MTAAERAERTRAPTGCVPMRSRLRAAPRPVSALVAVGWLRPPGAGAVQRPRRRAGARRRGRDGGVGGPGLVPALGLRRATSTTRCARVQEVLDQAAADLRVATGMLDVRHLAGDPNLTLRLRTAVLNQWRRDARTRLEELRELVSERGRHDRRAGARVRPRPQGVGRRAARRHRAQGAGGELAGRRTARRPGARAGWRCSTYATRCTPWPGGRPTGWRRSSGRTSPACSSCPTATPPRCTRARLARRITHLSRLAWRRAEAVQRRPHPGERRADRALEPIAPGVAVSYEEVVLDRGAKPGRRPAAAAPGGHRGRRARPGARPHDGGAAGAGEPPAARPVAGRGPRPVRPAAGGRPGPARRVGDARRDRGARPDACRSGSGCGCCRTPRLCTGSPSTGTSWRPASRPRR